MNCDGRTLVKRATGRLTRYEQGEYVVTVSIYEVRVHEQETERGN